MRMASNEWGSPPGLEAGARQLDGGPDMVYLEASQGCLAGLWGTVLIPGFPATAVTSGIL